MLQSDYTQAGTGMRQNIAYTFRTNCMRGIRTYIYIYIYMYIHTYINNKTTKHYSISTIVSESRIVCRWLSVCMRSRNNSWGNRQFICRHLYTSLYIYIYIYIYVFKQPLEETWHCRCRNHNDPTCRAFFLGGMILHNACMCLLETMQCGPRPRRFKLPQWPKCNA